VRNLKEFLLNSLIVLGIVLILWIWLSSVIFGLRHPWATSTEKFLYIKEAILLEKIPYNKMRPREE
jgi:hypothetical protein